MPIKFPPRKGQRSEISLRYIGPCYHGMELPQIADGGDGLQIWRVAVNILHTHSRTAYHGWSSNLRI